MLAAKIAAPDRTVVAITGDGFYMFATAIHSLWSSAQYKSPYLTIVYQNRSYSTSTLRVARTYPDGYAAKAGYHGGYFEPAIDFAIEARSAGAYGENVIDPNEIGSALQRGLDSVRNGTSAVISVRLQRLLQLAKANEELRNGKTAVAQLMREAGQQILLSANVRDGLKERIALQLERLEMAAIARSHAASACLQPDSSVRRLVRRCAGHHEQLHRHF